MYKTKESEEQKCKNLILDRRKKTRTTTNFTYLTTYFTDSIEDNNKITNGQRIHVIDDNDHA